MAIDPDNDLRPDAAQRLSRDDTRFALGRIAGFQYVIVAIFLFLITGFWVLQVRDGESNSQLAERNRIKTVPVLAPRGKLLDRDGRVIVDNQDNCCRLAHCVDRGLPGRSTPSIASIRTVEDRSDLDRIRDARRNRRRSSGSRTADVRMMAGTDGSVP